MGTLIAVDPGPTTSGLVVLSDGKITHAENADNVVLHKLIKQHHGKGGKVVIEDIKPYDGKFSLQAIETCKYIGVLQYLLKRARIRSQTVSRGEVREWVFETYPYIAIPRIEKKILYAHERAMKLNAENEKAGKRKRVRGYMNQDGTMRKPSYVWVDDRIVIACMKLRWDIETPLPGKQNRLGISQHAWQALAIATYWLSCNP
jgi:hypothetical protein